MIIFFWIFTATPAAYGGSQAVVESYPQLPAYNTATATPDPSRIWDLDHNPCQHQILNPVSKARDGICVLMDTSQICFHWAMMGTPKSHDSND